jgi:hypothetical protein
LTPISLKIASTSLICSELLKARLAEMGAWTLPGSPADCGNLIAEEIEKWAKVVRAGNIKPE